MNKRKVCIFCNKPISKKDNWSSGWQSCHKLCRVENDLQAIQETAKKMIDILYK